ncbi:MAG: ATP-binding protein [Phycisphaerales bacterium]|nr:ATP-binding protein [Phycisphaerales bacterium]
MDPISNPYAPGAGTRPPELAGRDDLLDRMRIALGRVKAGRPAKSILMVGLRGVGKTVLLDRIRDEARASGLRTMRIEAPEGRSLPALLAPELRQVLIRLSRTERAKEMARRAQRAFTGFINAIRVTYEDVQVGMDLEAEPGLADSGDLEHDLAALFEIVGQAAILAETAIVLCIDELQYVEEAQLAALITALHRVSQQALPIVLVGAGLPQLRAQTGRAKSYAERLFDFPEIGALDAASARDAIVKPASREDVVFEPEALDEILRVTLGYPYFIQEWGKHVWDEATSSPISLMDVQRASASAMASLDESFFRVRFDRLTPAEKRYLRAMAALGQGPHRSGDIAEVLERKVTSLGPTRGSLISKGMVWSPSHGDTAFTVPLFDEFMHRIMPGDDWRI